MPNKHKKNPISMGFGLINSLVAEIGQRRPLLFFGVPGTIMGATGLTLAMAILAGVVPFGWSWALSSAMAQTLVNLGALMVIAGLSLTSLSKIIRGQVGARPNIEGGAKMEVIRAEAIER